MLLSYAERLLALTGEMQAAFSAGALTGVVRLGVAETIVHTWLATLMQRLHESYPRLEVDIVVDVSVNLRAQLLAGEVDVALLMGPVGGAGVQDLVLCDYAVAWVAAPGFAHRFAAAPLTLAALAGVPIVTYARATRPYQQLRALFAAGPAPRLFANTSLASIARMVLDGIGGGGDPSGGDRGGAGAGAAGAAGWPGAGAAALHRQLARRAGRPGGGDRGAAGAGRGQRGAV